jgi:hypothetical protein
MSYTVVPYLVDLARLRAVYGSQDATLLATLILVLLGRFALGVALAGGRCRGWPCSCCPHWGRWS